MKTRNPNATCGNCPYYDHGNCRRQRPDALEEWCGWPVADSSDWCGEHPDFWAEETDLSAVAGAHPDLPDLTHPDPGVLAMQALARWTERKEAENERD